MVANQPWSGYFDVGAQLWATAHTTQVTQPGWKYLDSASGTSVATRNNGSLRHVPAGESLGVQRRRRDAWTRAPRRTLNFSVTGGLAVRRDRARVGDQLRGQVLLRQASRHHAVRRDAGSVTVQPGYVYSFTTTSTAGKGTSAGPPQASLRAAIQRQLRRLHAGPGTEYLPEQQGAFETVGLRRRPIRRCVRQMAPVTPITWNTVANPYTLLGDLGWSELHGQRGRADGAGRVGTADGPGRHPDAASRSPASTRTTCRYPTPARGPS